MLFCMQRVIGPVLLVMVMTVGLACQETSGNANEVGAGAVPTVADKKMVAQDAAVPVADGVVARVGNKTLTDWQVEVMIANGAAQDKTSAAQMWIDIKLRMAEVRRRGLDKVRENSFISNLFSEHYMGFRLLDKALIPEISDEVARQNYQENVATKYTRPRRYEVQHIQISDQEKAREALQEASGGANFEKLVTKYSQASDKRREGKLAGTDSLLQRNVGAKASEAVAKARQGDLLGPFTGPKGFEIIKVGKVTPEEIIAFDKVKDRIVQELQGKELKGVVDQMMAEVKARENVYKSPELLELEQKAKEKQKADQAERAKAQQNRGSAPRPTNPVQVVPR